MSSSIRVVGELSYDLSTTLGEGSFGTLVFSGLYRNKRAVAVKRVQKYYLKDQLDFLQWEVELMNAASDHPNILRCIYTAMNDDYLFIATELCDGTLDDYFNEKYQGPRFRNEREILRQVTRGLAHLHKLKIVHRDIKPANLLIFVPTDEEFKKPLMKLADFDSSKMLKTELDKDFTNTSPTNPKGTRGWMAPEVYQSKRFDFKVDVWSLGLIFGYTLSQGKHPFGEDLITRSDRIRKKEPMVLTDGDLKNNNNNGAFELIKSMLMLEPMRRPTVTGVLKEPFLKDEDRTAKFLSICEAFIDTRSITYGKIVQFKKLVNDETVDVNATTTTKNGEEMSPLHLLCRYYTKGDLIELIEDLLSNGADVNSTAIKTHWFCGHFLTGMTPLHLLFYENEANKISNMIDIVRLLLTNNADVNAKDGKGTTPLHYLCQYYRMDNLKDIIQLLVENGANVNAKGKLGRSPLHNLFFYGINGNLKDSAQLLLTSGADVNAKDVHGNTPLHKMFRNYTRYNLKDIAQLFVETGADVNVENNQGETPLHYLCEYYYESDLKSFVLFLVEKGANINTKNKNGETPSDLLRKRGIDLGVVV